MIKKLLFISCLSILTNCSAPGTAFLGPALTGAKTGSISQATLSYGSGKIFTQINPTKVLFNSNSQQKIENFITPKLKILDIPYVDKDPIILVSYKIDLIEFSEIIEPEPLP